MDRAAAISARGIAWIGRDEAGAEARVAWHFPRRRWDAQKFVTYYVTIHPGRMLQ